MKKNLISNIGKGGKLDRRNYKNQRECHLPEVTRLKARVGRKLIKKMSFCHDKSTIFIKNSFLFTAKDIY